MNIDTFISGTVRIIIFIEKIAKNYFLFKNHFLLFNLILKNIKQFITFISDF